MHHLFLTLWRHRVEWFWPIWTTLSLAAAFASALLVRTMAGAPLPGSSAMAIDAPVASRSNGSRNAWLAVSLFGLFVIGYLALILVQEHFDYYDNSQFTLYTLKGHNYPPPIWQGLGRFFPLAFQEFNVIQHFSRTVFAYQSLPIFELLMVCLILLTLDRELNLAARVCLAAFLLLTPGMVISFGGLIYPERNVIFWLLCLVMFVGRFDQRPSTLAAVAAIISAQFLLYYKETAFLLLWGFVVGRLLLRCMNAGQAGWDFRRLREKASRLDLCLFSLGLIFLFYYVVAMYPHSNLKYANQQQLPEGKILLAYFKTDLLAWLFVAVVIIRACLLSQRKIVPSPLWEGLAWGASVYFLAFLGLKIYSAYYLAPVDTVAVLYLGRLIIPSWKKLPSVGKLAITVALLGALAQNLSLSTFREFERKNLLREKDEIASAILARCQQDQSATLRLFFPYTSPRVTMEFAAYLSYRGVPIEGIENDSTLKSNVLLVCRSMATNGPLQNYRTIIGHAGSAPEPGDLVVVMPDDDVSLAQVGSFLSGNDPLFSYAPQPALSPLMFQLFSHCHIASPEFERKKLPDHWLYASVTEWKIPNKLALAQK